MQFLHVCSYLLAICVVLGGITGVLGAPSRDSGSNSWRGIESRPQSRPFYYDAPIRRPNQPQTMYA